MESYLTILVDYLSIIAEVCGVLVIFLGVIRTVYSYFRDLVKTSGSSTYQETIRLRMGRSLTLGLEFLIAADILKTAVAPSWTSIGQLAAIIGLRTALGYFLGRDIEHSEKKRKEAE